MPYKLTTGSHVSHGKTYRANYPEQDMIEDGVLGEREMEILKGRIVKVGLDKSEPNQGPEQGLLEPEQVIEPLVAAAKSDDMTIEELLSHNVTEIAAEIATIIDVDLLDSIQQEEIKGKGRDGVFKVIEARKKQLRSDR